MSQQMYHKRFRVSEEDGGLMDTYVMEGSSFDTVQVRNVPVNGMQPFAAQVEFPAAVDQWGMVVPDAATFFGELERRGYTSYYL